MTNRERMLNGMVYSPDDKKINAVQSSYIEKLYDYNLTRPSETEKRVEMLNDILAEVGKDCYIEPPFHANWGGKHVHFGNHVYANFNLTIVDDADVFVGDDVMFAPNVTIATTGHTIDPELRKRCRAQFVIPVHIGNNVWIGAGAVILPGVTIGDNSVIGAGSVVSKDIPANVIAVGSPCRVLREINAHDKEYYYKDRKFDSEIGSLLIHNKC